MEGTIRFEGFALLARLFLFFTIFPLVELALLLLLGHYTNVTTTIAFVLLTGLLGAIMLRWQGLQAWRRVQEDLAARRMPTESLVDGLLIVVASLLLITPGVLTDFVGITLLIPWCRRWYRMLAVWYFQARFLGAFSSGPVAPENRRTEVIDSYVVEEPPQP